MSNRWMAWALAVALCLGRAGALAAQDADEHHRNACRLAEQVLTLGQPANRREWALQTVPACGASGGRVLAAQLLARGGDTDASALEAMVFATSRMTDASLFRAGLELGADPSAAQAARAAGWRVALYQLVPGSYARPEPAGEDGEPTATGAFMTAAPMAGAPLPADAPAQAREAVLRSQAGAPAAVRDAMDPLLATAELQERIARVCAPGAGLWDDACTQAVDADEAAHP
jgi:hypothetical protein